MSESPPEDPTTALRDARSYLRWLQSQGFMSVISEAQSDTGIYARETPAQTTQRPTPGDKPSTMPAKTIADNSNPLDKLNSVVCACQKCRLGGLRKQAVFGAGNPNAALMFIGEAPGATEDNTGLPFVGAAGKVLTQELEKNGIRREDVFITNIIKCRPPENRDPLPDEIESCEPYLHEQISLIKPKVLCGLGRYACATLLKHPIGIMKIRGTWDSYHGLPLFICLHPSATLHQQSLRSLFDGDIAALAKACAEKLK
jgi:DNA polymerase